MDNIFYVVRYSKNGLYYADESLAFLDNLFEIDANFLYHYDDIVSNFILKSTKSLDQIYNILRKDNQYAILVVDMTYDTNYVKKFITDDLNDVFNMTEYNDTTREKQIFDKIKKFGVESLTEEEHIFMKKIL